MSMYHIPTKELKQVRDDMMVLEEERQGRRASGNQEVIQEVIDEIIAKIEQVGTKEKPFSELSSKELAVVEEITLRGQESGSVIIPQGFQNDIMQSSLDYLRVNNYTGKKIITPDAFRMHADKVAEVLMRIATLPQIAKTQFQDGVIATPWRSALVLAEAAQKIGYQHFYHIDIQRNEHTLKGETTFEEVPRNVDERSEENEDMHGIVVDPMLATGGTMLETIAKLKDLGILEKNIILVSVISAPEGIARILYRHPQVRIVTGNIDYKLSGTGYIVGGERDGEYKYLGDFGDQYFEGLTTEYADGLYVTGLISEEAHVYLKARIIKHIEEQAKKRNTSA